MRQIQKDRNGPDEGGTKVTNSNAFILLEKSHRKCKLCGKPATVHLTDLVKGRKAAEIAALPKEEILEEVGIPLTPVRMKCAILGLGVVKVALNRSKGTPLPEEWQGLDFG